mmetsp:Transcript_21005/g.49896  ORF Transcript_21005/g.49896 Transcript_21005/m.49896 type:complete len:87 (+) Transcript_21005:341-601(+)
MEYLEYVARTMSVVVGSDDDHRHPNPYSLDVWDDGICWNTVLVYLDLRYPSPTTCFILFMACTKPVHSRIPTSYTIEENFKFLDDL